MRILIVVMQYAPQVSPRAFRWTTVAEHWAQQGHQVDVVCSSVQGLPQCEFRHNVAVNRVGGGVVQWLRDRVQTQRAYGGLAGLTRSSAPASSRSSATLLQACKWLHDATWKRLYWPDCFCLWYFPAWREVRRQLRANAYDAVISVSAPFTPQVVVRSLRRRFPNTPWLVDIGDPFCFVEHEHPNNYRLYQKLNSRYERGLFREADVISVTTPGTAEIYARWFPESASKIHVIPPLLSPLPDSSPAGSVFPENGKIRLVFVGTLYAQIRNPRFLLGVLRQLFSMPDASDIEMHFFGDIYDSGEEFKACEDLLGSYIYLHGRVDRGRAIQAMREADVLVNLGNSTDYQLPSKVVEYASTGKPIANLVTSEHDSSLDFFRTYPLACVLKEDADISHADQASQLLRFAHTRTKAMERERVKAWLAPHRIEAVAGAYERLLFGGRSVVPAAHYRRLDGVRERRDQVTY